MITKQSEINKPNSMPAGQATFFHADGLPLNGRLFLLAPSLLDPDDQHGSQENCCHLSCKVLFGKLQQKRKGSDHQNTHLELSTQEKTHVAFVLPMEHRGNKYWQGRGIPRGQANQERGEEVPDEARMRGNRSWCELETLMGVECTALW